MSKLQVWVLYDGKPGHLSQSLGLAQQLSRHLDADIHTIKAKVAGPLRRLALGLCRLPLMPARLIAALYRMSLPKQAPDLVISFGGKVVPLNAALAHRFSCANILIGNRYGLSPALFNVLVNARSEGLANQVVTQVPFCRQMSRQLNAREQLDLQALRFNDAACWTLLIGGDGSGYSYTEQDWQALVASMVQLADTHNIRWLVSTSRRTPQWVEQLLETSDVQKRAEKVILFNRQPESIKPLLLAGQRLFVTADSLSMLTEAISCDRPVVSVAPSHLDKAASKVHQQTLGCYRDYKLLSETQISEIEQRVAQMLGEEAESSAPFTSYSMLADAAALQVLKTLQWQSVATQGVRHLEHSAVVLQG
ncbi:ELM1/GtrOC1 family putative glycosyltransferase [Neptuniibacter sp. CAU 1671]|uniref:ELM1/GtrOC1 family putative glycosyltransferase n=1 Tax=Neptuniibacter sp. CAU 1671 TaxID=3032593 RepID=UPI0023DA0A65|nr:ELM1/GtrOC1 family putative glycosyltransferase [Neptuniibacter sp. CAU 1671]MDF2181186.1 ELM1/GtrOC1 family putative glycosyltransferase [Neptuniibacter sp. CAU 1671]